MALLNSLCKCPGTGFMRGRLRKFMLRAGIGYFNWGDIRPFLARSQGHRAGLPTLRDSFSRMLCPQLSSVPGGAVDGARQTLPRPSMLWEPSWRRPRPLGLEKGQLRQGAGGAPAFLLSKDHSCVFRSTPTKMFYIF